MTDLFSLQEQISKLQKEAQALKARDFDKTVKEIREKMQVFGITIKDLQAPTGKSLKTKKAGKKDADAGNFAGTHKKGAPSKSAGKAVEPKFKGPDGQTWTGRGLSPKWLKALIDGGAQRENFLIKPATGD